MGATSLHFSEHELACHHCGKNECKQELVDALELFRIRAAAWCIARRVEFPGVFVNDAYRCAEYNASTPNAAKASQHVEGLAADIRVPGLSGIELETIARRVDGIHGIGRSDYASYLHVDVRPARAEWCYNRQGASITYSAEPLA